MRTLINGVRAFHKRMTSADRDTYGPLADGQEPTTLFFTCADSRVVPVFLATSAPGALFTVRNVGNLVPPADLGGTSVGDHSEASAIEYAVGILGVTDIVVCGHSGCGAMAALSAEQPLPVNLGHWLAHARDALHETSFPPELAKGLPSDDVLSQRNVLLQLRALATYPDVKQAQAARNLRLHGWWFDIGNVRVDAFDAAAGRFVEFDSAYPEVPT